jgi:hypothetical protein
VIRSCDETQILPSGDGRIRGGVLAAARLVDD